MADSERQTLTAADVIASLRTRQASREREGGLSFFSSPNPSHCGVLEKSEFNTGESSESFGKRAGMSMAPEDRRTGHEKRGGGGEGWSDRLTEETGRSSKM